MGKHVVLGMVLFVLLILSIILVYNTERPASYSNPPETVEQPANNQGGN